MTLPAPWIIVNPTAGSGRALAAARDLAARLPEAIVQETEGPGDAVRLAQRARKEGAPLVVAVGGDGTIQQCVAGLSAEAPRHLPLPRLAVLPAGTGGDFRRTFGFSTSVSQAHARIAQPNPISVDIGRVTYQDGLARKTTTFANVLSFGIGGLTDRLVDAGPKWVGGRAAFFMGALRATAIYQPIPVELRLDDQVIETAPYSNVAVCIGKYFGGGMKIAPDANPSDGFFDVVTMEMSKLGTMTLAASIYQGRHFSRAGVKHYRCKKVEALPTRAGSILLDVDGEQLGQLPISVELIPSGLTLLA